MNTETGTIENLGEIKVTETLEITKTLGENEQESTKVDGRHNNPGRGKKTRVIMPINQITYSGFESSFKNPVSFAQYNVTVGAFVEWAENRGIHNLLAKDVESFLSNFAKTESKLKTSTIHLEQFYKWMLENGYSDKIHRSMLLWLIVG